MKSVVIRHFTKQDYQKEENCKLIRMVCTGNPASKSFKRTHPEYANGMYVGLVGLKAQFGPYSSRRSAEQHINSFPGFVVVPEGDIAVELWNKGSIAMLQNLLSIMENSPPTDRVDSETVNLSLAELSEMLS